MGNVLLWRNTVRLVDDEPSSLDRLSTRVIGEMNGSEVYHGLKVGQRLEKPSSCSASNYEIMQKCWEWDEHERPNFFELFRLLHTVSNRTVARALPPSKINERKGLMDELTVVQF
jgi:hypothetical protein